jgi:protein-L-isoaspartate(D-aspartate) O-methyltransferase
VVKPDPLNPQIANGSFEERNADGEPAVWYYHRQLTLVKGGAPEGRLFARFENQDPGREAQTLQGLAVDGRAIGSLRFTLNVRADNIVVGPEPTHQASLEVNFFDAARRPIGAAIVARWVGTFDWRDVTASVPVPPTAREAILRLGLNGATGRLDVDAVKVAARESDR